MSYQVSKEPSPMFKRFHKQVLREAANALANFMLSPRNMIVLRKKDIIKEAQENICRRIRRYGIGKKPRQYPFKLKPKGYYCLKCMEWHPLDITLKRRLEYMAHNQDFFKFLLPKGRGKYQFAEENT